MIFYSQWEFPNDFVKHIKEIKALHNKMQESLGAFDFILSFPDDKTESRR